MYLVSIHLRNYINIFDIFMFMLCHFAVSPLILETLYPLTSNTKLLKEALNKGIESVF